MRHSTHLSQFQNEIELDLNPNERGGKNARSFGNGLEGVELDALEDRLISRGDVFKLVREPSVNTVTVCAAALAWGGMRISNRNSLWSDKGWLQVAEDIRFEKHNRKTAYEALDNLSQDNQLKGMGPAYFTKLIYFLMPRARTNLPQAYIMDQWAGCSINLLFGSPIVLMDVTSTWERGIGQINQNFVVSKANSSDNYEKFCAAMDELTVHFHKTADQIDRTVMGNGGINPSAWRQYVIENRRQCY